MNTDIRIVLIEDDATIRDIYTELLSAASGYVVAGAFDSYEAARPKLEALEPKVILLDVQLKGISGVDAISKIKKQLPDVYIIMLTVFDDEKFIFTALGNGASGYLTKNTPPDKIIAAIHEVLEGGGPMSAKIAKMVIASFKRNESSPLSRRETEILEQVATGKSRKRIAEELYIDLETVKTHIKNIYAKLDVHSKADAIKYAKENKFI